LRLDLFAIQLRGAKQSGGEHTQPGSLGFHYVCQFQLFGTQRTEIAKAPRSRDDGRERSFELVG
jgi:hypothetical protein